MVTWAFSFLFFLLRQNPKDVHTLAQLISAYSLVDPEKAKVYPFDGGNRTKKEAFGCFPLDFSCVVNSDLLLPEERQGTSPEQLHIYLKLCGATLFP